MKWFATYRADLLRRIYAGSPYSGSDKLDALWPLMIAGGLFAAVDLGLGLKGPIRTALLAIMLTPPILWAGYVISHDLNALRLWIHRGRESPGGNDESA